MSITYRSKALLSKDSSLSFAAYLNLGLVLPMKRDWNLIRHILFYVEGLPPGELVQFIEIGGFDQPTITEHVRILINQGFLAGNVYDTFNGSNYLIKGINREGYEFIENARNNTIWKKVMSEAKAKGTSITMVVLNGLLTKAAQKYAGLD